jgi:hypothetical protein
MGEESIIRTVILLVPGIGNIIIFIFDLITRTGPLFGTVIRASHGQQHEPSPDELRAALAASGDQQRRATGQQIDHGVPLLGSAHNRESRDLSRDADPVEYSGGITGTGNNIVQPTSSDDALRSGSFPVHPQAKVGGDSRVDLPASNDGGPPRAKHVIKVFEESTSPIPGSNDLLHNRPSRVNKIKVLENNIGKKASTLQIPGSQHPSDSRQSRFNEIKVLENNIGKKDSTLQIPGSQHRSDRGRSPVKEIKVLEHSRREVPFSSGGRSRDRVGDTRPINGIVAPRVEEIAGFKPSKNELPFKGDDRLSGMQSMITSHTLRPHAEERKEIEEEGEERKAKQIRRERAIKGVSEDGEKLLTTYKEFAADIQVVLAALGNKPYIFKHLSKDTKNDRRAVSYVFGLCSRRACDARLSDLRLVDLDPKYRSDEEIVDLAIEWGRLSFAHVAPNLQTRERALRAVQKTPEDFFVLPESFQKDLEMMFAVIKLHPEYYTILPEGYCDTRDNILNLFRLNGELLRYFPAYKGDKEAALVAFSQNEKAYQWMSEELQKDLEILELGIRRDSDFFATIPQYLRTQFQKDPFIADLLVESSGWAFRLLAKNMQTKKRALTAVRKTPAVLEEVGEWADDEEVVVAALERDGIVLEFAQVFQDNRDFVKIAVQSNGLALRYAKGFQDDESIVALAIQQNGEAFLFASPRLQRDNVDLARRAYTQNRKLLKHMSPEMIGKLGLSKELDALLAEEAPLVVRE